MTDTNPRDLIKRLADEFECWIVHAEVEDIERAHKLVDEARAYLAQPEPEGPTDEELTLTYAYVLAAAVDNKRGPFNKENEPRFPQVAAKAAQWGRKQAKADIKRERQEAADEELEACAQRQALLYGNRAADELRAARRPKPQSLKEQSIALLDLIQGNQKPWQLEDLDLIRCALESIPDPAQPEPEGTIAEPRGCPTPGACSCPTAPYVPPDLIRALELAEAALADIGDAERESGDDLAWAEARAAQDLPRLRAVLARWGKFNI